MQIDELRIYSEVYEQGLDIECYLIKAIEQIGITPKIKIIYPPKKVRGSNIVSKIYEHKKQDILITAISDNKECPMLAIEYSTAAPVDDHLMQRADIIWWGAAYGVPTMKILPENKRAGDDKEYGGGSKITSDFETYLCLKSGLPFYQVKWKTDENREVLKQNKERLSCIPYDTTIESIITSQLRICTNSVTPADYFETSFVSFQNENSELSKKYNSDSVKDLFRNSSRIHWNGDSITVKINRFGHAMDPERGMIYFMSMLLGKERVFSEIQIERDNAKKYGSLFDGTSREMELLIESTRLLESGCKMTSEKALELFLRGINADSYFKNNLWKDKKTVLIDDKELRTYMALPGKESHKFMFTQSSKIILSDKNRGTLVEMLWNEEATEEYKKTLKCTDYSPAHIEKITIKDAGEDLITYLSVGVMRSAGVGLLSVSYPGAQGDVCILDGEGRTVDRTYVDVIAYVESQADELELYLQENKEELTKTKADVEKLNLLRKEHRKALYELVKKQIGKNNINSVTIGIGVKKPKIMQHVDVDYIMTFDLNSLPQNKVKWQIWTIDKKVFSTFDLIKNGDGKLIGIVNIGDIYRLQ